MKKIARGYKHKLIGKESIYYFDRYKRKLERSLNEVRAYSKAVEEHKIYIVPDDSMMDFLKHQYTAEFILERLLWVLYDGLLINFSWLRNEIMQENLIYQTLEERIMKNKNGEKIVVKDNQEMLPILKSVELKLWQHLNNIDDKINEIEKIDSTRLAYLAESMLDSVYYEVEETFDFVSNYLYEIGESNYPDMYAD